MCGLSTRKSCHAGHQVTAFCSVNMIREPEIVLITVYQGETFVFQFILKCNDSFHCKSVQDQSDYSNVLTKSRCEKNIEGISFHFINLIFSCRITYHYARIFKFYHNKELAGKLRKLFVCCKPIECRGHCSAIVIDRSKVDFVNCSESKFSHCLRFYMLWKDFWCLVSAIITGHTGL